MGSVAADFNVILVCDVIRWRGQNADERDYNENLRKRAGISVAYCAEQFRKRLFARLDHRHSLFEVGAQMGS